MQVPANFLTVGRQPARLNQVIIVSRGGQIHEFVMRFFKRTHEFSHVAGAMDQENRGAEKRANLNMTNNYMTAPLFQSSMKYFLTLFGLRKLRIRFSKKCVVITDVYY